MPASHLTGELPAGFLSVSTELCARRPACGRPRNRSKKESTFAIAYAVRSSSAAGRADLKVAAGRADLQVAAGRAYLQVAAGRVDLQVAAGRADLQVAAGRAYLQVAAGRADLKVPLCGSPFVRSGKGGPKSTTMRFALRPLREGRT
jgi:hypothetical protein